MRAASQALRWGLLAAGVLASACASGFERNGDDDDQPRIDAPSGGGLVDARLIDGPGAIVDAPLQTDAPTTGGIDCPDTQVYSDRAFIEILTNPNFVDCLSGADCSSSQCCYGALVCVAYP